MSRQREKDSIADYRKLSITSLKRDNCLAVGRRFNWIWSRRGEKVASINIAVEERHAIRLTYQSSRRGADAVQHDYRVEIDWTACHLGGERPWFRCPDCSRRVLDLYGGARYTCRHCRQLNYQCQQASKRDRALDRSWELRRKLGCDTGMFDLPAEYIQRPKGMHRRTFSRHIKKLTAIEIQAEAVMDEVLGTLNQSLTRLR